jgi:hypothetical protein
MNIFVLAYDPLEAAKMHCDKHVVKMVLETAQLLSTAHRVLDGRPVEVDDGAGGTIVRPYQLRMPERNNALYKVSHINHPCSVWVRQNAFTYEWTFTLFRHLLEEYTFRYGKLHKCQELRQFLWYTPENIPLTPNYIPFVQAMPDDCKDPSVVTAYRNYYNRYKHSFAKWTIREQPEWFNPTINGPP